MKHIRKIAALICQFTILYSCTYELTDTYGVCDDTLLTVVATAETFTSVEGVATRASENLYKTEFTNGDQIGITAIKDGKIVDRMNNICFTYNALTANWAAPAGSPSLYYYQDVTYLAYYPYDAGMNDKTSEQSIIDNFTPETDQSIYDNYTKSDLMTGTGIVSVTNGKHILTFQLTHQMSLLVIYPRGQHYQVLDGYDFYAPPKDITTLQVGAMTAIYQPGDCTFRAIVMPGTIDVTINYTTTENATLEYIGSVTAITGKFSTILLTPTSPVLPYTISVGDYFLFDGGLLPATVALAEVNKKNCIGLVFKVGRFGADDSVYINGKGEVMNTINGYVVALKNANNGAGAQWGTKTFVLDSNRNGSTPYEKFDGFKITHLLKTDGISNYPAANACLSYTPAANTVTSGWFFPAGGQMLELRNTRTTLKTKSIFTDYNSDRYWQSVQNGSGDAWSVGLTTTSTVQSFKTTRYYVRAILAF